MGLAVWSQNLAVGYRLATCQSLAALAGHHILAAGRQNLMEVPQSPASVALRKGWRVAERHSLVLGAARHRETLAAHRKEKGARRMAAIRRQKRAEHSPVWWDHTNLRQRS